MGLSKHFVLGVALLGAFVGAVLFWFAFGSGLGYAILPDAEASFAKNGVNKVIASWNERAFDYEIPVIVKPNVGETGENSTADDAVAADETTTQ